MGSSLTFLNESSGASGILVALEACQELTGGMHPIEGKAGPSDGVWCWHSQSIHNGWLPVGAMSFHMQLQFQNRFYGLSPLTNLSSLYTNCNSLFIQLGIVAFLAFIGLPKSKSSKKSKKTTKKAPSTPKRTPSRKEAASTRMAAKKAGSVETPAGRRSARIARKQVKK